MRQMSLRKFAIATSTVAVAALFSVGWSGQGGLSLSVDTAQAQPRRLYVAPILMTRHHWSLLVRGEGLLRERPLVWRRERLAV